MRRILAALVLLVLPAIAAAQVGAFTTGGPVSPAGVRATVDIPPAQHLRNAGGSDNEGLCVFTATQITATWQHVSVLDGFRSWMERRPGGGWPEKLDNCIKQFCHEKGVAAPAYVQHVGGDAAFLELALATGRLPCVTYAGMDGFYKDRFGRDVQIGHMVNLAHMDDTRAAIIDNNRPGVWVWMTRAEFLARWRAHAGGWAVVFLAPPPPPHPSPVTSDLETGQCGPNGCPLRRVPAPAPSQGDSHFGLVSEQIGVRVRWMLNGAEVARDVANASIVDDSALHHLVAVGDATLQAGVRAAVSKLTDANRLLVNAYPSDHWAVAFFGLKPGVTLRNPSKNRVGSDVGTVAAAEGIADLVDGTFHPKPPAPPAPPPAPTPDPLPAPQPTVPPPARGRVPVLVYALLGVLILLQLTNRRVSK